MSGQSLTSTQIDRLFHYSQVYGTVRYFHPYMSYQDIQWDEAWAQKAPAVLKAKDDEAYAQILEDLLTVLKDPSTKVVTTHAQEEQITPNPKPFGLQWLPDSSLVIKAESGYELPDYAEHDQHLTELKTSLGKATAVIFDWRFQELYEPDWAYLDVIFGWYEWEEQLFQGEIRAPAKLRAYHRGFRPEQGTTSGGYYTGYTVEMGKVYQGKRRQNVPIVFIVNNFSITQLPSISSALQAQGLAEIINVDKGASQSSTEVYKLPFGNGKSVHVRASEMLSSTQQKTTAPLLAAAQNSRYTDLLQQLEYLGQAVPNATSSHAPFTGIPAQVEYPESSYPELGHRLLAAARIYTIIDLFFPYKHLMDEDWATVTKNHLSAFVEAQDEIAYHKAIFDFYHHIQDSHGGARGTNAGLLQREVFGRYPPPFYAKWIEDQVVIQQVLQDSLHQIAPGDVVLTKNGVAVKDIMEQQRPYSCYSTEQAFYRSAPQRALLTVEPTSTVYSIHRPEDGSVIDLEVSTNRDHYKNYKAPRTDTMRWLTETVAYADLNILASGQVDVFFEKYAAAEAIVFDMRGYPNGTAWSIAPRLTDELNPELAIFNCPLVFGPNLSSADIAWERAGAQFMQSVAPYQGKKYQGEIVVLINENAVSQAEHTCLFLEQVADVTFIGSPTTGANGDVTNFVIPGGLRLSFSGQGIRHADGRQLQRKGILPDIECRPTIAGTRKGEDEVLLRAIRFLEDGE